MGLFSKKTAKGIDWKVMESEASLGEWIEKSNEVPVLFFKHSTRCSISSMAKNRLETNWDLNDEQVVPVYLDLIAFRSVSNLLAEKSGVTHESPQALLFKNGEVVYNASHNSIRVEDIANSL